MRVLFVCQTDFRAPTEKVVLGYSLGLARLGHEVLISVGGDPGTAAAELAEPLPSQVSVRAHRFRGPRLRRADVAAVAEFQPDIAHPFNPRLPVIRAAAQLVGDNGARVVGHFEDDEWGISSGAAAPSAPRRGLRALARAVGPLYPPSWPFATPATLDWIAERSAAIEAITPALAARVEQRLGRKCEVILPVRPSGRDQWAAASPPDLPASLRGLPLVVFTGAVFAPHAEDFRLGLRAVAELQRRGIEVGFVHAGAAAPRFDLAAWARAAGIREGTAAFLGYLPSAAMLGLLRCASVLVQPGAPSDFNRFRLPSKLQTYLASGVPTVTFACGAGELFEDRREVLKTHGDDPGELADRIGELLTDEGLRATLAAAGPRAAERLFDLRRNCEALLALYQRSITETGGR